MSPPSGPDRPVGRNHGWAGLAGAALGIAVGVAAGVAAERQAVSRARQRPDPLADEFAVPPQADAELKVTTADGVDLHVEVVGSPRAPLTAVFVHGYTLSMQAWHFQRLGLSEAIRSARLPARLVFYDHRGHGRSQPGDPHRYTIDQLARDLDDVIAHVAPTGPLVVVGHSIGGMAVMALAEQRPDLFAGRVVGVTLISTSAGDLDTVSLGLPRLVSAVRKPATVFLAAQMRRRSDFVQRAWRSSGNVSWLLTRRFSFGTKDVSPTLVDFVESMIIATPVETIAGFLRSLSDHKRYDALRVIDGIDSLIICGDRDRLTPVEHSKKVADALPGAELVEVPLAGHLALLEYPDVVNQHVAALVHRAARAAGGPGLSPRRSPGRRRIVRQREA